MIKLLLLLTAFLPLAGHLLAAELSADYEEAKATAERLFSEGSYSLAHAAYGKLKIDDLPISERRWVEFRLADTQWRSQGATQTADTTKFDEAKHQLEVLIRDISKVEEQDRVWAEVHESLGDLAWTRRNQQNWGEAWPNYEKALDWWAGAADVELARQRYLKIVWRLARPPEAEPYYYYGYYGNYVPLQVIRNALEIARTDEEKVHVHYLIAMTLRTQAGDAESRATVPEEFEAAIKMGKKTEWYDDALYNYAEWMTSSGRFIPLKEGGWQQQPDYPKALELFRRFVNEFREGESRYWQQADSRLKT